MELSRLSRSLTGKTLLQMIIRITAIVIVASVISYFYVKHNLESQTLEQLQQYVQEWGARESAVFVLAQDNLRTFTQEYSKRLEQLGDTDPRAQFKELFAERDDGSIRLRERFFASSNITGVIGKYVDLNDDLQRRLVIGYEMLIQYGPAWQNRFANLYITTPEHAILIFWPGKPWGLNANSWEVNAKLALNAPDTDPVLTLDDRRAERKANWSTLYFDYAVNDWMVSVTEPVNLGGQYKLSVGHDMLLHELIERTISSRIGGTYNILLRDDGRLLAHSRFMDAIQAQNGNLSIATANDAQLTRIFDLVKKYAQEAIIDNSQDDSYLAVTRLKGPGWYLVTVFPKTIIAARAFLTARLIFLLGVLALLVEIATTFFVLRTQLARPLNSLMEATNRIATGDFNIHFDDQRLDEIGRLARSFNTMSEELSARESALSERSAKLALLNQQLERELEERKRAEQEIARQREALHQSEKLSALGSLLAGVSHELNNPLSVVVGRSIMLEEEATDVQLKVKLSKIRQAAERCARIVKTFLSIARQQPPERKPVSINALIEAAVEMMAYSLRTADIETVLALDVAVPGMSADADQLTQVFTNLMVNAQQALMEVAPPRRLKISTAFIPAEQIVKIVFADNGPGVPRAIRSRIFEPFYTSKPMGIGTGIGLPFSYGVITSHGGRIELDLSETEGACFAIMLPLAAMESSLVNGSLPKETGLKSQSILIVDDEVDLVEMLGEMLAAMGHRINIAASGNEALRRLSERDYDVILSDLKMPDLDGPSLYRRLQQSHPHLIERMIFISGDTFRMGADEFLARTGRPLLEKPFIPREVIEVVNRVLSQAESPAGGHGVDGAAMPGDVGSAPIA